MLTHAKDLLVQFRASFSVQIWLSVGCPRPFEKVLTVIN